MRASGTLLRLARALVDSVPSTSVCSRATIAEPLFRLPPNASAACSGAARAFAEAAPAADRGADEHADLQRQEWELGSHNTAHTLVTSRQRTLDDFEQLIGVLIRRRRLAAVMNVKSDWHGCMGNKKVSSVQEADADVRHHVRPVRVLRKLRMVVLRRRTYKIRGVCARSWRLT